MNRDLSIARPTMRILIADDHPVVLAGLRAVFSQTEFSVLAAVDTVGDLLDRMAMTPPDIVICDYQFDSGDSVDGIRLVRLLRTRFPCSRIIVFSMLTNAALIRNCVGKGGADAFVSKSKGTEALIAVCRRMAAGKPRSAPDRSENDAPRRDAFTPRELDVVRMMAQGMSLTEIARRTFRSLKTISAQKRSAMEKSGARNDGELLLYYFENKL